VHQRNEERARRHCATNVVGINPAHPIHLQVGNLGPEPFQKQAGVDHCRMFDLCGDDVDIAMLSRKEQSL